MQALQKPINVNVNVNVDDEEPRTAFVSGFSSCNNDNNEIVKESRSDDEVDLESGDEIKMHALKDEKDCRICHMSLDVGNQESGGANGLPIELGCCCKDDLAVAHKHCAEAWFKIKGNKTCEICGSVALNVTGPNEVELVEQWNEGNEAAVATAAPSVHAIETRHFWQGHRFLNFLLAYSCKMSHQLTLPWTSAISQAANAGSLISHQSINSISKLLAWLKPVAEACSEQIHC